MKIIVVQGVLVDSGKIHAELRAIQHNKTGARGELHIAGSASHTRGTVPGCHRQPAEIGCQLPVGEWRADVCDIQLKRGHASLRLQYTENLHAGRGKHICIRQQFPQRCKRQRLRP